MKKDVTVKSIKPGFSLRNLTMISDSSYLKMNMHNSIAQV